MSSDVSTDAVSGPGPVHASTMSGPAISVKGLKKTYTTGLFRRSRFEALKEVTFDVPRGEVFGLLGPNGAGKTTFLKIMLGIIRKSGGEASLLGFPAGSREGRQRVGYLPEHLRVPQHLTGHQALEFFGNLSNVPTKTVREKRGELLELVGLAQRAKDNVKQYSKGMLQRLGLAQALLHDPELLVLDEPTDGLDPRARADMRQIIRNLQKRGVTIFLNSHLLQEVEMVCNRVAILDKGNVRYCGDVSAIGDVLQGLSGATPGTFVEFEVLGDAATIKEVFEADRFKLKLTNNQQSMTYEGKFTEQTEIDSVVDKIRSAGLSLIALRPRRTTLEDAFLQLIDESSFKN